MKAVYTFALVLGVFAASGCTSNEEYIRALGEATAASELTLIDAVGMAEAEVVDATCVRAALIVTGDPVFSVGAVAVEVLNDVRIDPPSGEVVSVTQKSSYTGDLCLGGISLIEALTIAEERANGEAVASVPDDDVACAREIQVLRGSELWEVKVASDGTVLEYEESDEDGSGYPDD